MNRRSSKGTFMNSRHTLPTKRDLAGHTLRATIVLGFLGTLGLAGCADQGDLASPTGGAPGGAGRAAPGAVMPDVISETSGLRWEKIRDITEFGEYSPEPVQNESPAPDTGPGMNREELLATSVEELATRFRPILQIGTGEYRTSWDDSMRLASRMKETLVSGMRERSGAGPMSATGVPRTAQVERISREVVDSTRGETRQNWSEHAGKSPYNRIASMQFRETPNNRVEVGHCTCFKLINHHTCVTAAHCLWNYREKKWLWPHSVTFGAGSSSPLPTIDPKVHPYGRIISTDYYNNSQRRSHFDYALLRFRGTLTWEPRAFESQRPPVQPNVPLGYYDVGYFGWTELLLPALNVRSWTAGFPRDTTPPGLPPRPPGILRNNGWPYPTMVHSSTGVVWIDPTEVAVVRHDHATELGQSGSPILMGDSSNPTSPVIAIHTGWSNIEGIPINRGVPMTMPLFALMELLAGY
jgi:V8-like Glu-specific endopeptidase